VPLDPKTLIYTGEADLSELLRELADVRAFDKTAERKRRGCDCLGCVGALGGVLLVGFLIGLVDRASEDGGGVFAVVLAFVLIASGLLIRGVVGVVRAYERWGREDLDDRRYVFLQGLLPLLAADVSDKKPVRLEIDFWPMNSERKKTRPDGVRGNRSVVYVADDWLTLRGRFADGTVFVLKASDTAELRFHRKPHKNKSKTVTRLVLRLRPKLKRYGGLDAFAKGAEAAVQLPPGCTLKKLRVAEEDVRLTTAIKYKTFGAQPDPEAICPTLTEATAAMFLSAYQVLNLSRYSTRRGGPKQP
jgi:hypothetical protein